MKTLINVMLMYGCLLTLTVCNNLNGQNGLLTDRLSVILDTDANNELDDQHAIAYLLSNGDTFNVRGITVNTTYNGGDISEHYAEAERVVKLCNSYGKIPIFKGANGSFKDIKNNIDHSDFDGSEAVDFIIEQAKMHVEHKLIIIAVGKLTNVALALEKDPAIYKNIRLVWLGSNYPEPGEYNLENDIPAMNYLLESSIHFEMVMVRYEKPSGTDAVRITKEEALTKMAGLGPQITEPVTGRHGGTFYNFGDYSVSLFKNIDYDGDPPSRALFDMAAVAIVKNPEWAEPSSIPCPRMVNEKWIEQPDNTRKIIMWENFSKDEIISDFYISLKVFKN
jgi:hypothetical protein